MHEKYKEVVNESQKLKPTVIQNTSQINLMSRYGKKKDKYEQGVKGKGQAAE